MGIIIISSIILIIGIILLIIEKIRDYDLFESWVSGIGFLLIIISFITLTVCSVFIIINQITKQKYYEEKLYEYNVLEYRLEHKDESIIGNELLYNDIVEFNKSLNSCKRYSNNFWLNWFINDKIATIDYIEIDGVDIVYKE